MYVIKLIVFGLHGQSVKLQILVSKNQISTRRQTELIQLCTKLGPFGHLMINRNWAIYSVHNWGTADIRHQLQHICKKRQKVGQSRCHSIIQTFPVLCDYINSLVH